MFKRSRKISLILLKLATGLALAQSALLPAAWIQVRSQSFELLTDSGEKAAKHVLDCLEEVRRVFSSQWTPSRHPIRVILLKSAQTFAELRPTAIARAFYQGGGERDYLVLHAGDDLGDRAARHEYVHAVLQHTAPAMPKWYEEGTADFYSNLKIEGEFAQIGLPIPEHLYTLARSRWLDAQQLAEVSQNSPHYEQSDLAALFYAQSWALVHMLHALPEFRTGIPRYPQLLAQGVPPAAAFQSAFSKSLDEALQQLRSYISTSPLPSVRLPLGAPNPGSIEVTPLSPLDGQLALAELFLLTGKQEGAERIYLQLAKQYPESPQAAAGLGILAVQRRDFQEARRQLRLAIERGDRSASTYLEYAMLIRDSGGSRSEVRENLYKALEANPDHPEVHFVLGVMASGEEQYEEAVAHLKRASATLPRQSSLWHALAMAYYHLNDRPAARHAAQRALQSAANSHESQMAQAALALMESPPQKQLPRRRLTTIVPESWKQPEGEHRVEGQLVLVECSDAGLRLHIDGPQRVVLQSRRPNRVRLKNSPDVSRKLSCGPQKDLRVAAEYQSDGELVALEFR